MLQPKPPNPTFLPTISTKQNPNLTTSFFNKTQHLSKSHSLDHFNNSEARPHSFINLKSLKNLSNNHPIDITPSEIIFRDIAINQTYEMSIYVRNLSKIVRRIRIFQPQNNRFRCDYDMAGAIAAGLAMKLSISFETSSLGEFQDKLRIISDDNVTMEVPLSAYPVQSQIIFEPFINFGFVKTGDQKVELVSFKNEGKLIGKIEIKVDKIPDLSVEPNFFTLNSGQEGIVKVKYIPKDAGILRGNIDVIVDGGQTFQKSIEINATSVEFNRFLIDEIGNLTRNLDFGTVYFGQQKEIRTFLVNNTPKGFNFKAKFRIGLQREGGLDNYQTPNEMGCEQTEKIVSCVPEDGFIESYSQKEITFKCKPKLTEQFHTWTRSYAMSKDDSALPPKEFDYSIIFEFNNEVDSNTIINLSIIAICPKVKLSSFTFNFSECPAYDHRDIEFTLENLNDEHPVDFSFERQSSFNVTPIKSILSPNSINNLVASFCPKNMGSFNIDFHLYLIKGNYKIPLNFSGNCNSLMEKIKKNRGLESLPESFIEEKKFLHDDNVSDVMPLKNKKLKEKMLLSWQSLANSRELIEDLYKQFSDKYFLSANPDEMIYKEINKKVYNDFMKSSRFDRSNFIQQKKINLKMAELNDKLREMGILHPEKENPEFSDNENSDKIKHDAPIDQEFFLGLRQGVGNEPKLILPELRDTLCVQKPIAQYEPLRVSQALAFAPNADDRLRKKFPSEPKSHKEIRDTNAELAGEILQKIFAGPKIIDFGMVFVKSTSVKTFTVRNDLRNSILVKLEINYEELRNSYTKPQVIPPGEIATFEIVLCSNRTEEFRGTVKYIINNKMSFEFLVIGLIELVTLEPDSSNIKFSFDDNNNEMEVIHRILIRNKGNAQGHFRWLLNDKKIFTVEPKDGDIPAFGKIEAKIIYRPSGLTGGGKEDESLVMKVDDGFDQIIKCSGFSADSKCIFIESALDLGEIPVSEVRHASIQIKNCFRHPTVFRVQTENLPPFTNVTPEQERLGSEETKHLHVNFSCNKELDISEGFIIISIRGGKPIRLPFSVKTLIPKLFILQEELSFGGITTLGNPGTLELSIHNESNIAACLDLDLREREDGECEGVDCVNIEFLKKKVNEDEDDNEDDEEIGLISINGDQDQLSLKKNEKTNLELHKTNLASEIEDDEESKSDEDESMVEEHRVSSRHYEINIKKNSIMNFLLKFTPKDVKNYSFNLPLTLKNYGKLESLSKLVKCRGLKPKLLIDPQIVDFKRKIIANDKFLPTVLEVSLSNPDLSPIFFQIDTSELDDKKVFSINPSEGTIEGGHTLYLRASFNPFKEESYSKTVPLFIDRDKTRSYLDIHFKGVGAYPKLTFDKREVIMPIVPLNISTKCQFKVINDGYENLTLKENFSNDFNGNLKLTYLDGRNLGVTKNKIKLEVSFCYEKPFSFTSRLDFMDNDGRTYTIPISGTCDNCLLTNYSYIQRLLPNEYKLICEEGKPILLQEDFSEDSEIHSKKIHAGNVVSKAGSALSSKSARSVLGYVAIPINLLEKSSELIVKWLNHFALNSFIQSFPADIISNSGSQLFDLLNYLLGKQLPFKAKIDGIIKKVDKMKVVLKQYETLILFLQGNGAFLSTIRPYYLLSYSEYNLFVKNFPNEFVNSNALRMSEQRFRYISLDCWITLFYQMIKIYSLNKITLKTLKNLPNIPIEKQTFPDHYLEGSNIYSTPENLLLRWLELYIEQMSPVTKPRLQNFGADIKDSLCYLYLLQAYIGPSINKFNVNLKPICKNEDDFLYNAEKILGVLHDLGLETHLKGKDLAFPTDREMILFLIHIFNSLIFFIPQKEPIIFSCVLGEEVIKYIELTNPSPKPVAYWVKYEGPPDFSIEETNIRIEARTSVPLKFKVKFVSRVSNPITGRLTFFNKKESNAQAAALVFDLKSQITDRQSEEKFTTSAALYQTKQETIQIKNKFTSSSHEFGEFIISISNEKIEKEDENLKKRNRGPKKPGVKKINTSKISTTKENILSILPPFFCSKEKIRLRKGESAPLTLIFMPFFMETYRCKLVFTDKEVGEFQYEIIGETLIPEIIGEIRPNNAITIHVDTHVHYEHQISFKNEQLAAAKKIHENRLLTTGKMKENIMKFKQQMMPPDEMSYNLELQPPSSNLAIPTTFKLNDPAKSTLKTTKDKPDPKGNSLNNIPGDNKLPFDFSFKQPISNFSCNLIMRSEDKSDIRIYKLVVTSAPKPIRGVIELKCPAGEELKQQIPIVNNSDKDWQIKAQLSYDISKNGVGIFTGSKDLLVKRRSAANYIIGFQPQIADSEVEGKLVLSNQITGDHYEYELSGKAEEPLSKSHILINCVARRPEKRIIEVQNPYKDRVASYLVETDLINSEGVTKFTVDAGKVYKYNLTVTPVMGGVYTGSLTFFEEHDKHRYIWYTVCINTDKPRCEKTFDLSTFVRKTLAFDITLRNPLKETLTYEIAIEGEGLTGETLFQIGPLQTSVYELRFTPLRAFKGKGSVAFIQEKLGELWYDLNLISENKVADRVPTLKAELGKFSQYEVVLENPSGFNVQVIHRVSNPNNFDIIPDNIILPPMSAVSAFIRYTPSDLDINEAGEVIFESEDIGNWYFMVFGVGLPPTKFEPKIISCGLHKDLSYSINFKNPFKDPINVIITLEAVGRHKDSFQLLLRKNKIQVQGLTVFQIPLLFAPREINEYQCEIVVFMNEKIQWRYPIKGVTESILNNISFNFKVKSRETLIDELKISLPGLPNELCKETFNLEIENIPTELMNLITKSFKITPTKTSLSGPEDHLKYKVNFSPMKPFKSSVDILISIESGGRWKFKLNLEATEPEEDDVIQIFSPINKTSSVSFRLANRFKSFSPFTAFFSPDSDSEFSVMPRTGELEPYGREGKNFIISFTPVEYGKMKQGKLVVQTDEIYWSFLVKGTFPQYKPPETHSIINSKLNPDIYGKMKSFSQKNFLLENIKKSKQSPEKKKQEESKYSKLVERTFLNTLSKVDLSKTSINVFTNKDLLNKKKNEKLDPLVLNSFKLKTASDGFQK